MFTFTNIVYATLGGATSDLASVNFIFGGTNNTPVAVDNVAKTVSYLITVDGGKEYSLSQSNFVWPSFQQVSLTPSNQTCGFFDGDCSWSSSVDTQQIHYLSFDGFHNDPIEVVAKKQGTANAPDTGLIVQTGDTLEFTLKPEDKFTNSSIAWQICQLQSNGSLTSWTAYGSGDKLDTTAAPGIFQLKAIVTAGTDQHEYVYVRKHDDIYSTRLPLKKGDPDAVGVADTDKQIAVRSVATNYYGSVYWSSAGSLPLWRDPLGYFNHQNKCNVFVADVCYEAGASAGQPGALEVYYRPPPSANRWAGMPNLPQTIPNWALLPDDTMPQPGYVAASGEEFGPGHVGVVDYDGRWISAASDNVTRNGNFADYKRQYFGTTRPAGQRKYSGN